MGTLGPLLKRRSDLSIRNGDLLYKQFIRPKMDYVRANGGPPPALTSVGSRCYNPSGFALPRVHPSTLVAGIFTRICVFHHSPTKSEP